MQKLIIFRQCLFNSIHRSAGFSSLSSRNIHAHEQKKCTCHIVNFPYMDSNIPSKPAYGVYISQLVRIGCICDSYKSFFTRHHQLTSRLVKQGFLYDKLVTSFKGFCSRYPEIFSKFKMSIRKHVEDGICLPTVAINRLSTRVSIR